MMKNCFKNFLEKIGLMGWIVQRISAVMMVYFVFLLSYVLVHNPLNYWQWHILFAQPAMKIFSMITLLSLLIHAWIGVWTISTDYIHCCYTKNIVNGVVLILSFSYLVWGIQILWGISRVYS